MGLFSSIFDRTSGGGTASAIGMAILLGIVVLGLMGTAFVLTIANLIRRARRTARHEEDPGAATRLFADWDDASSQSLMMLGVALATLAAIVWNASVGSPLRDGWFYFGGACLAGALAWWRRAPLLAVGSFGLGIYAWVSASRVWTGHVTDWPAIAAVAIGAVALARLAEHDTSRERLAHWLWLSGLGATVVLLWIASSRDALDHFVTAHTVTAGAWSHLAMLVAVIAASAAVLAVAVRRQVLAREEVWAHAAVLVSLVLTAIPWAAIAGSPATSRVTRVLMLAPTIVALGLVLASIVAVGMRRREEQLVTVGIVLGFVFVLFEYGDWIYPHLDSSVGLAIAGALFIALGFAAERGRRRVIAAMGGDDAR
jgi:hypothetical protein